MTRPALLLASLLFAAGCSSPCEETCKRFVECGVVADQTACVSACEQPPGGGHPCSNQEAIASCVTAATCDELTKPSSRLSCPACL